MAYALSGRKTKETTYKENNISAKNILEKSIIPENKIIENYKIAVVRVGNSSVGKCGLINEKEDILNDMFYIFDVKDQYVKNKQIKESICRQINKNIDYFRNITCRVGSKSIKREDVFNFSPSVKGKAIWADVNTLEFIPDEDFVSDKKYKVEFRLGKIADVPSELIEKGMDSLNKLLPRESKAKDVDMALLSLIYPYNIASNKQKEQILANVEKKLLRARGIIRYAGDKYYNKNGEAEWTMGLPWMAIVYRKTGRNGKYKFFMRKTFEAINGNHELPELYFANSDAHNENSPLGWSQSLLLVMLSESRQ